jgi:hypothetical protein
MDAAPRYVYRNGARTPMNLTRRPGVDTAGISTFERLEGATPPGGKAQVIDTAVLRRLVAILDDVTVGHVSIAPSDPRLIADWAATRGTDVLHPFTQEVIDAVVDEVRRPR